jgi:anti-sigma B factor antagonist
MFGFFQRRGTAKRGGLIFRRSSGAPDFGFGSSTARGSISTKPLASYDRLGQTLVGTPLLDALTGPDAGKLANDLYEQIQAAQNDPSTPAGIRHVVLDLQNVRYMDSMCVGVLVELLTMLKEAGGQIALANASNTIECLFKLTRLDRVFPICRDVMKAISVVEREG